MEKENKNYEQFGEYYCPCKIKKTTENICPCLNAQNEINQNGHCHCLLYWDNNPISFEIDYTQGIPIEGVAHVFSGQELLQVEFYHTDYTSDLLITDTGENKRILHIFKYNGIFYESPLIEMNSELINQLDNWESLDKVTPIFNLSIQITEGDISFGFVKLVNELFIKFLEGEKSE